jgi:osmotically-inducible protein OsmY
MRRSILALSAASSLALGGCAASIAASVVGAAVRSADAHERASRPPLVAQEGVDACSARASAQGQVSIIDSEVRSGKLTVWGTVQSDQERQAFECSYSGKVTAFKLRPIPARPRSRGLKSCFDSGAVLLF